MKQFAMAMFGIAYAVLGIVGWFAEVDGLNLVLGWPKLVCWIVAFVTAGIPLLGTALGIWGAHAAWGWGWLPSIALFCGGLALCLILVVVATMLEKARSSVRRQRA
jgi:hypothetical protein